MSDDLTARSADGAAGEGRSLPDAPQMEVVVVTGLSGGGKTAAAKLFEDLGYVVVDNLPGELLRDLADLISTDPARFARTAIVLDVRAGDVPLAFGAMRGALEGRGIRPGDHLPRGPRRRPHPPLQRDPAPPPARGRARHRVLDHASSARCSSRSASRPTSSSTRATSPLRELRERIFARLGDVQRSDRLAIQLISFGFKYGVPLEADLVLDVRFMKNPHYIEALRPNSGLTAEVREYVLGQPIAEKFLAALEDMLDLLVPAYIEEGKTRLTIAIGCTGGFHRSIVMSEELATLAPRARLRHRRRVPSRARAVNLRRWLTVGIGVKRWLLVAFLGLIILALGVAHALRQVTAALPPDSLLGNILNALTMQTLPYELRGLILGTLGAMLFSVGAYRLVRALVDPFALWDRDLPMVEVIYQKRFLARGPRVVAMGGGTGLSTLLRGLKEHTSNLTAVVTVADDGGSTGVLRDGARHPGRGRHPQLHRRARRRRAADGPAAPVPLPGRRRQHRSSTPRHRVTRRRRRRASAAMPSATCCSRPSSTSRAATSRRPCAR